MKKILFFLPCIVFFTNCKKSSSTPTNATMHYFQVSMKDSVADWRDSAFVVATSNQLLIKQIDSELLLPVAQRQFVFGTLVSGDGGYNVNASHSFLWHLNENNWSLSGFSAAIYDGRPYSDVDSNINHWVDTLKSYGPWNSYISSEVPNSYITSGTN